MNSILIGKIVNTHGIKGEVKVYTYTDDIVNLSKQKEMYFDKSMQDKHIITSCKIQNNMLIIKFSDINDTNVAEKLRDTNLYIEKIDIIEDNTYYIEDLIGMDVIDIANENVLGKITYVFNTGANDVYEVKLLTGENAYLPAIKQVIKNIDVKTKKMYVEVMEGLI